MDKFIIFTYEGIKYMIPVNSILEVKDYWSERKVLELTTQTKTYYVVCDFDKFRKHIASLLNNQRNIIEVDETEEEIALKRFNIPPQKPRVGM